MSDESGTLPELEAESLVYGGDALGRLPDGTVVFFPYALPGERLRVRIRERKAGYLRADPVELLRASPQRQTPRCRHFGDCGGCQYQHAPYPLQLELKTRILREQLARIGRISDPPMEPALPSPSAWTYRNHLQFHLAGDGRLGFHASASRRIVPLEQCHLPEPPLGGLWPTLSALFSQGALRREAAFRRVILRLGSARQRMILLESAPGSPEPPFAGGVLPRELDDCAVWWHRPAPERRRQGQAPTAPPLRRLAGEEALEVRILGESFRVSPLSFFQVNTGGAETMVRQLLSLCGDRNREHVLELYCGVGLFTRFLARRAAQVTAVEVSPSACADFRANLGLPKGPGAGSRPAIRLVEAEAADALVALASERGPAPELVVADPPRAGLGREVVGALSRLRPERLVYVSCDPATLARDAAQLVGEGWSVERLRLVDLFPQTAHVESVSLWHGPSRRGRIGT